VIKKFFSLTLPLSIILQKVDVNLLYYYKRMAEVCRIFEEIEELKNIFFYSEVLRNERINEVPRTIYRQKIQDNIPTYFLENIIKDMYFYFTRSFNLSIKNRFTNHYLMMSKLHHLFQSF